MTTAALVLHAVALVVMFGVRSWVQHRRTGVDRPRHLRHPG
jgi:hypothetical protein